MSNLAKQDIEASEYRGLLARLVIFVFVAAQFINVEIFSIGSFAVSFQKIAGVLVIFSYFLTLRVWRNFKIGFFFFSLIFFTYTFNSLVFQENMTASILADTEALMSILGALALYNVFYQDPQRIRTFGYVWIGFAVTTSIICVLQMVRILPLFTVPGSRLPHFLAAGGHFLRAIGFRTDPNFQALSLVIGLTASCAFLKGKFRFISIGLILIGIFSTFSRMGMIVALVVLFSWAYIFPKSKQVIASRIFSTSILAVTFGLLMVGISLVKPSMGKYLTKRVDQAEHIVSILYNDKNLRKYSHLSSAETRLLLAEAGLTIGARNWWHGIGAYQTQNAMSIYFSGYAALKNAVHDTYIELFLVGGVWGLVFLLIYGGTIAHRWKYLKSPTDELETQQSILFVKMTVTAIVTMGLFLSLTYNSIFWLPLVLVWVHSQRDTHPHYYLNPGHAK